MAGLLNHVLLVSVVWLVRGSSLAGLTIATLVLVAPGLWLTSRSTTLVAIMLSILYVVVGIMEAFANAEQRALGLLFLLASAWFFLGLLNQLG